MSILEFPRFFVLPEKSFHFKPDYDYNFGGDGMFMSEETYRQLNLIMMKTDENVKGMNNIIELMNFTDEAFRNYHYLWYSYIMNKSNLKLFCMNLLIPLPPNGLDINFNCTAEPLRC